jgi:hypothetical protein
MRIDEQAVRAAFAKHQSATGTTRRDAIKRVAALFGGAAIIGQTGLLAGCATNGGNAQSMDQLFMASDLQLLDEIADTVLPDTSTPGAKAAGVGPFMIVMVTDTYTADEQTTFTSGLAQVDAESMSEFGVNFLAATAAQQTRLLERLDREQFEYMQTRSGSEPTHYFRMMKQLTLLGYFTSEIGCTQAQRYREAPGRFEPCVPYSPGDRAWAAHA